MGEEVLCFVMKDNNSSRRPSYVRRERMKVSRASERNSEGPGAG